MTKYIYPIIILSLLLSSCNLDKDTDTVAVKDDTSEPTLITVNQSLLPIGPAKQAYLLLTNPNKTNKLTPRVTINGQTSRNMSVRSIDTLETVSAPKRIDAPKREFNLENSTGTATRAIQTPLLYDEGATEIFNVIAASIPLDAYQDVEFTLKSKTLDIGGTTVDLYIWVDSSEIDSYPIVSIPFLKDKFSDIYPDMVHLYGEPWGNHTYPNLIDGTREDIHILLMDIAHDENVNSNTTGSIYGYFTSWDLQKQTLYDDTSRSLNLVIDSFVFFNRTLDQNQEIRPWSENNRDTIDGVSTLIHEFQHMINLYQKGILLHNQSSTTTEDIFVDEMLAMIAEDLLAEKYLTIVTNGETGFIPPDFARIPSFNSGWMNSGSFFWETNGIGSLQSYSNAYALGAYLIRNYSGFVSKYIKSNLLGIEGIIAAINEVETDSSYTKKDLLHNFGLAVLNSNNKNTVSPIRFNDNVLINYMEYEIAPFNLFSSLHYNPVFTPYTFDYHNTLSTSEDNFLAESNIYINLGELSNTDIVEIEFYEPDSNIEYSIVF